MTKPPSAPRCAALVGPYTSGKTTLLESILLRIGATNRKGAIKDGSTVGDASQEARERQMTTELNIATAEYLGEDWTFIDCPGSIELIAETQAALMVCDIAIVVCEPAPEKALTVSPLLKFLDDHSIPHIVFVNRMDAPGASVRRTLEALQAISQRPLVLRELPIRDGEEITGFVDLVSERAWKWNPDKPSELIQLPDDAADEEQLQRNEMLEALADFDDGLMEELLEDVTPSTDEVYDNLTRDLQKDLIVPVLFGSAERDHGINRVLKALRHEAPGPETTADRLGLECGSETVAQVFKTLHAGHAGKLSIARVWNGEIKDGMTLDGTRISGVSKLMGGASSMTDKAATGEVVALGRMEPVKTGDVLSESGKVTAPDWPAPPEPLFAFSITSAHRGDEVKLSGALTKVVEEDPSLSFVTDTDTGEHLLRGQGEVHLQIALARLKNRYGMEVNAARPQVPYKETIRKSASHRARHKKQSGGHGEFGDVHLEIAPQARGEGFTFSDRITGGVVPKQYIPAVETGVREFMARGPLGFPVVDVAVALIDGQFHTVDSSDMAFKKAAQLCMREAMPTCGPVLLEPILNVSICVPTDFTSKVQRLVSGRRGQLLGFDAREGWTGWDEVKAMIPQAEIHDLIIELRSLTLGMGTYSASFERLQELTGRAADEVVSQQAEKVA